MEDETCFICLGDAHNDAQLGPLGRHCGCKALFSHRSCLTRWQLQNAGKAEEKQCRFCKQALGDWRTALTEVPTNLKRSPPIMAVVFQGKTVKVPVVTGPEGVAEFKRTVCKLFNLPEGTEFEVTFECKSPVFGDKLHLKGFDCFEAASYCAAVSAAKRATHKAAKAAAASTTSGAPSSSSAAASSAASATTLPVLRGAYSVGEPLLPPVQQPPPSNPSRGSDGQPVALGGGDLVAGALASPSRLIQRLNESLLNGDRLRRNPRSPLSDLRHASSAVSSVSSDGAIPLSAGGAQGLLCPEKSSLPQGGSSGALTPASSSSACTSQTPTRSLSPPMVDKAGGHGGGGSALSFMRRLRTGMLCSGPPSVDTHVSDSPFAAAQGALSASGAEPELVGPSSCVSSGGVRAGGQGPAAAPTASAPHSLLVQHHSHQPLATSSLGSLPMTSSSLLPSAAALLSGAAGSADLQDPGSPAYSASAAHHMGGDHALPAAHVATTTVAAHGVEAKSSGYQFSGSLVSMFRRMF